MGVVKGGVLSADIVASILGNLKDEKGTYNHRNNESRRKPEWCPYMSLRAQQNPLQSDPDSSTLYPEGNIEKIMRFLLSD
jgi:hypothetical protein